LPRSIRKRQRQRQRTTTDDSPNVANLKRGYEAWGRGDLEATLQFFHPDIEWRNSGVLVDIDREYHGHEGVRQFWRDFRRPFEEVRIEVERYVERNDEVLVYGRFRARGRDGIELVMTTANVYTFRDGLVVHHISNITDPERWLEEFES
jgi:uncharacterized protein